MAKQVIIGAIEEVLGEYILNIDKENLKIAALRGKIRLENVQLDGDLLGSHVLGAVGLSGFGILSCWAKSVKITVPLTNLEKEPTRCEMRGVHLICLPLLPSTAHKMYGAGTAVDPRCTLRTRAKRSKLVRFEDNFMSGRITGEGPPAKRVLRAVREVERALQKKRSRKKGNKQDDDEEENSFSLDSLALDFNEMDMDSINGEGSEEKSSKDPDLQGGFPDLPRDWKVKLREKVMRNLVASMHDIHVRCEVSEGGLDFCHPDHRKPKTFQERKSEGGLKADQRAFALGFTLDNFIVRTANENWEVGSHEKAKATAEKDHLGPNPYDARNNKLISFENYCMYWDDDPSFLISETDIVKSSDHKLSAEKVQTRTAAAMAALFREQEPGQKIRESLQISGQKRGERDVVREQPHQYCFEGFNFQVRQRISNRLEPGPISCRAEFPPFHWDVKIRPHQYVQYQKLKSAMLSQQRFDTMLRQRPNQSPVNNPRGWWKYTISCVTTRPNSRPWHDVLRIARSRSRYVELVMRKMSRSYEGSGFHAGLSESESAELLALEDLLPIEALLAFHLLALRKFTQSSAFQTEGISKDELSTKSVQSPGRGMLKGKSKLTRMFRSNKSKSSYNEVEREPVPPLIPPTPTVARSSTAATSMSLLEFMTERLGKKPWYTNFKLIHAKLSVTLITTKDVEIAKLEAETAGNARSMGPGNRNYFFDVTKFEIVDSQTSGTSLGDDAKILVVQATGEDNQSDDVTLADILESASSGLDSRVASGFMELPPAGVVCRVASAKDLSSTKLSLSAHPATLVWTRPCFDALAEFFGAPSTEMQTELTLHLKNAATPLARKAQLALLSPTSLLLHINVAAPKIWVPFSSRGTDGALFLDAGHFRMSCTKGDGQTNMNWDIDARDIQANFARWHMSQIKERIMNPTPFAIAESPIDGVTSIIRPFHVRVVAGVQEWQRAADAVPDISSAYRGPVSCIDITISPICLNLVDAEVLARAIGKWYAQGIVRVRGRVSSGVRFHQNPPPGFSDDSTTDATDAESSRRIQFRAQHSMPHSLSVTVEKIEMALEGHSKAATFSDEKSIESLENSILDYAPPTRTYVVEVFQIAVRRSKHNETTATKFLVTDASIVQLEDAGSYVPMKSRHEATESQYSILERGNRSEGQGQNPASSPGRFGDVQFAKNEDGPPRRAAILNASLFHDGMAHLDEVEIDIDSVILRVTPTSLKDCVKGIRKIVELVQLMTREMERKVHEEGRKARQRDRDAIEGEDTQSETLRPTSPTFSVASDLTDLQRAEDSTTKSPSDSSLLFKVTINDSTLLAGRPTSVNPVPTNGKRRRRRRQIVSFAVVQVFSNALIMFQSIENPDGSGTKTLHISLDNLSASVDTEFERVPTSQAPPMVGPTGAEFRVVYATENLGCVVSNDISLDCEHLKSCLTPNDMSIFISIVRTMLERLRGVGDAYLSANEKPSKPTQAKNAVSSLVRYQRRGTGIATSIRVEFHTFSFVLLRAFRSKYGAPEFLAFNLKEMKARLGGCMSALSGECTAGISVDFFNAEVSAWEYAVEPFPVTLAVDQMPNEIVLDLSTPCPIQLNLTGIFLRDFAALDFDSLRGKNNKATGDKEISNALTPSALSTVGLRRATESHSVSIQNNSGLDIIINPSGTSLPGVTERGVRFDSVGPGLVRNQCSASLDSIFDSIDLQKNIDMATETMSKLCLGLSPSAAELVGDRELVSDLPITSSTGHSVSIHVLRPAFMLDGGQTVPYPWQLQQGGNTGRASPETVFTEGSRSDYAYYHAEPVVEWCMQNQRLRSSTVDFYSLQKGSDLLSSSIWSPEEEHNVDTIDFTQFHGHEAPVESFADETLGDIQRQVASPTRKEKSFAPHRSNWLRPYLKNDSPEWTDMTCILRMARERVMLPDNNWIWVNDWTVDLSGNFGESTDADGWEYQADFETFTRTRRFYQRGDCCRRRRWTRTRIVKPPRLDDPQRLLKFVWETSRDEQGNFRIEVKSHVTLHNSTSSALTFFVFSPSWDEDKIVGSAAPGDKVHVPVSLSSAAYLRLAKRRSIQPSSSIHDYVATEKLVMLPTSYNSSVLLHSSIKLDDVSETDLYFLVNVQCKKGIIDIFVEPVLRVVNLLPCQLECQFGEVLSPSETRQVDSRPVVAGSKNKRVASVETLKIASGTEGKCLAINPASKPHISLRVPGYKWSAWQRIVNRKADSYTWRPSEAEEDWHIGFNKGDTDYAEEFKSLVRFDRITKDGDPLVLIISVECGHSPTLRVYSQYWILDKTGFGCRFCEGFTDLMGTAPDIELSRRSHLLQEKSRDPDIQSDLNVQGHQWSIGMSGMTLYFSLREKIALSIESGAGDGRYLKSAIRSKWVSPMDISNVMPKTVFSVDELGGPRRFELAISVTVCPGVFARTRLITLLPRYQIVNLLKRELVVAQDGCLQSETLIPSQSAVPFHWERQFLPSKVRLGAPSPEEKHSGDYEDCWTNGRIQLDKVGITSMRLPTSMTLPTKPMVVQAEVRLASKDQSSAVVIVIWSANEESNPLYLLRNKTSHTILCRQPLQDEPAEVVENTDDLNLMPEGCVGPGTVSGKRAIKKNSGFECGSEFTPMIRSFLGLDRIEEFVWVLRSGDVACFGFDDPEKPHILEWACVDKDTHEFNDDCKKAFLEVDAMGSSSSLSFGGVKEIRCQIGAEHSTKVIEFTEKLGSRSSRSLVGSSIKKRSVQFQAMLDAEQRPSGYDHSDVFEEDEDVAFSLRLDIPVLSISVIDNADPTSHGREILLAQFDKLFASFSQSREGYHEMEMRLQSLQVDNHVPLSIHPVLIFCPCLDDSEPFLHMSAVRRLQQHSSTYVFRYAAFRVLEVNLFLDRRTAETVARFIEPFRISKDTESDEAPDWLSNLTVGMGRKFAKPDRRAPRDIEQMIHTANSGRIYFEQLHLHPVRLAFTFTQEWMELNQETESLMVFQFIRGMASIADAPLTFTSFVVGHVFESPQALLRVITTHYSSQLTKQIFGLLGSLAILGAPADFISNVGTGVRDFFYEPIQGAVHGPRQFIEGLEAGTQSLARGVFVGVVRGAANVTEVVNANLAGLTADDDFIDERKAHQRMLTDAMSRGVTSRTFSDSLYLAGASISRGMKSGALGIVEQPTRYASKHGPVGFVKGVGKAAVGAVVKPIVGLGDAAALLMNHVSDATSNKRVLPKIPKRLRRALPSRSTEKPNCVILLPYDDRAAKAQKIVTGGESVNDVYIGHVNIPSHLIIASDQCLWAIDRRSREPWCVSWEEISHFGLSSGGMRVVVFSQCGLRPYVFQVESLQESSELQKLLSMQLGKMGNATSNLAELRSAMANGSLEMSLHHIPGIKSRQAKHVFGSCNKTHKRLTSSIKDEIDLIEQCFGRVKRLGSDSKTFFETLDGEAWTLVSCWGQVFSGLSSRRCIAAGIINGTGNDIQIKSTKLVEGGSPCYSIPTREFDPEQGVLHAGGAIIFFGWGVVPSLLQAGNVFMNIETNAFIADLSDTKSRDTYAEAMSGYQIGFLEKSYDDAGWWAKYWLLIRKS